jgi:hypothetical protein
MAFFAATILAVALAEGMDLRAAGFAGIAFLNAACFGAAAFLAAACFVGEAFPFVPACFGGAAFTAAVFLGAEPVFGAAGFADTFPAAFRFDATTTAFTFLRAVAGGADFTSPGVVRPVLALAMASSP